MTVSVDPITGATDQNRPAPRRTLLLIDDDSLVGRLLGQAAEECGCEAIHTLTMSAFQGSFGACRPDIAAVDLCVPGYDGTEILRFLAAERFDGLVLIVSGLDHRLLDAALRLGTALGLNMVEPLAKPFRIEELAERLAVAR